MPIYRVETIQGAQSLLDLEEFMVRQLEQISQALESPELTHLRLTKLFSEPRTFEGLVVWADGTSWDPGSGEGVYHFRGAAWVKLG